MLSFMFDRKLTKDQLAIPMTVLINHALLIIPYRQFRNFSIRHKSASNLAYQFIIDIPKRPLQRFT